MGNCNAQRWPGTRPADILRFGKAERGRRAFHLSQGGSQSVQRNHPWLRNAVRRSTLFDRSSVTEGRKMNLLGKLTWSAIPFDQPIVMAATGGMVGAVVLILGWITLEGHWPYLWREWITSVDHKRIGVMYCVLALIMLLRGFTDAIMMRSQQAIAAGGNQCFLPPEHYDQI